MDKARIDGAAQKMGGKIKEAAGKMTGDAKLKADGKKDQAFGSVKNAMGGAADAARDAGRRH